MQLVPAIGVTVDEYHVGRKAIVVRDEVSEVDHCFVAFRGGDRISRSLGRVVDIIDIEGPGICEGVQPGEVLGGAYGRYDGAIGRGQLDRVCRRWQWWRRLRCGFGAVRGIGQGGEDPGESGLPGRVEVVALEKDDA